VKIQNVHLIKVTKENSIQYVIRTHRKVTSSVLQHFNNQLMHTTLKNVELLKYFKASKIAPTCFGL